MGGWGSMDGREDRSIMGREVVIFVKSHTFSAASDPVSSSPSLLLLLMFDASSTCMGRRRSFDTIHWGMHCLHLLLGTYSRWCRLEYSFFFFHRFFEFWRGAVVMLLRMRMRMICIHQFQSSFLTCTAFELVELCLDTFYRVRKLWLLHCRLVCLMPDA